MAFPRAFIEDHICSIESAFGPATASASGSTVGGCGGSGLGPPASVEVLDQEEDRNLLNFDPSSPPPTSGW